jgi:spore coat polysaccharide biosynthesis predicted glycosyltransferase SpsG
VHRHFVVKKNVTAMAELMVMADLAVASFGVTAYELAAMGVPALYLCLTDDHVRSADAFEKAGVARCLGMYNQVSLDTLHSSINNFYSDKAGQTSMKKNAGQLVDGLGAERIAHKIIEGIGQNNG